MEAMQFHFAQLRNMRPMPVGSITFGSARARVECIPAKANRHRILQMRTSNLEDIAKLLGFFAKRRMQARHRGKQFMMDELCGGHMYRGRNDIVARLAEIDVVLGMGTCNAGDHLVRVHIR
jgi:hypothetical protein